MSFYKNTGSQKISILAVNTVTGSGVTGDAGNITGKISKDGNTSAATNDTNPTELNASNHPGIYIFDMTAAETNANMIVLSAASTSANTAIDPLIIYTIDSGNWPCNANNSFIGF